MEETYQELIDESEDEIEQAQDLSDEQLEAYAQGTFPEAKEQQNIYNWFWRVVKLKEPMRVVKVGNLSTQEIGNIDISVRDALKLGQLGRIFGHPTFGKYFEDMAQVISATSMAKKGWFMDLSISQKKVRERQRGASGPSEQPWRLFNKRKGSQSQEAP